MSSLSRTLLCKLVVFLSTFFLLFTVQTTYAADGGDVNAGKTLFTTNCASCHNPLKVVIGPALQGTDKSAPGGMQWIYKWVHNSTALRNSGDAYANSLYDQWKVVMPGFPQLTEKDIDNIFAYVNSYTAPGAPAPGNATGGEAAPAAGGNNSVLFGILTLVLAIIAFILMQVNSNLQKLANDKEGTPNKASVPFFRNKRNLLLIGIVLFLLAGYFLVDAATTVGYQQNYQPRQPILFSHKVHAGVNQINCLYCHAGAEKSRQAMIPSPNICMNCHRVIDSYKGELLTAEGQAVDGTAEIQKLYSAAGWDPEKKAYTNPGHPIEWVKIHNLPDFVYFNHSQHVKVGQVQCQTCHGPIQQEDEVYQYATLGMGWCVNCHRESKVQFTQNNYYSIFTKYHEELKNHQIDSVTEEMVGGIECQKCHY